MKLLASLLALFGVLSICSATGLAQSIDDASQMRPINCSIRASRQIELSPSFDGIVSEVFVRPGQHVDEGEPLLKLNTALDEAQLSVHEARANATGSLNAARQRVEGLRARVERLREAYERQAVSFGELEAVELDLRSADAEFVRRQEELRLARQEGEPLRRKIELATITSPAKGVIGENVLDAGEATQGKSILTLYVLTPLRVEAFVPRAVLPELSRGEALSFRVQDREVPADAVSLDYISPIADLASGTVSVFFNLVSDDILPGSQCEARLSSS